MQFARRTLRTFNELERHERSQGYLYDVVMTMLIVYGQGKKPTLQKVNFAKVGLAVRIQWTNHRGNIRFLCDCLFFGYH